jgi:hypothetical protein
MIRNISRKNIQQNTNTKTKKYIEKDDKKHITKNTTKTQTQKQRNIHLAITNDKTIPYTNISVTY